MASALPAEADYIIVGGGTAGLVVAQGLVQRLPELQIVVIEAGDDASDNAAIKSFMGLNEARTSKQNWQYVSHFGQGLNGRVGEAAAGKGPGGSALINAGVWLRGPSSDWNRWAELVGDETWRYDAMLPYFRRIENFQGAKSSADQHGYDGYMKIIPLSSTGRKYPLREPIRNALESVGQLYNPDPNDGSGNGAGEATDVWNEGIRPLPLEFLHLDKVTLATGKLVAKVVVEEQENGSPVATGVMLADGQSIRARREVILSAGSYQSPKILELSGIGNESILKQHGIVPVVQSPDVGQNLADHFVTTLTWELANPERGLALGSPLLTDPSFFHRFPQDFICHHPLAQEDIEKLALLLDSDNDQQYLLQPGTAHSQQWITYLPFPKSYTGLEIPIDGTHISTLTCLVKPTSRGNVHISSPDPADHPTINANALSTAADELMFTSGLRSISRVMLDTDGGRSIIAAEAVPQGFQPITAKSTDEDILMRVRQFACTISHPMGTCAIGKVVDSHCKVLGVERLRVVDASVLPLTPAATIQATVYAVAERAAEFIAQGI